MIFSFYIKIWLTFVVLVISALYNPVIVFAFPKIDQIYPAGLSRLLLAAKSKYRRKLIIPTLHFIMRTPSIDTEARLKIIAGRIRRNQRYPIQAQKLGIEGTSVVSFRIMPDGDLKELKIRESSGNTILDNWSLKTIRRSAPFPYVQEVLVLSIKYDLKSEN